VSKDIGQLLVATHRNIYFVDCSVVHPGFPTSPIVSACAAPHMNVASVALKATRTNGTLEGVPRINSVPRYQQCSPRKTTYSCQNSRFSSWPHLDRILSSFREYRLLVSLRWSRNRASCDIVVTRLWKKPGFDSRQGNRFCICHSAKIETRTHRVSYWMYARDFFPSLVKPSGA